MYGFYFKLMYFVYPGKTFILAHISVNSIWEIEGTISWKKNTDKYIENCIWTKRFQVNINESL